MLMGDVYQAWRRQGHCVVPEVDKDIYVLPVIKAVPIFFGERKPN